MTTASRLPFGLRIAKALPLLLLGVALGLARFSEAAEAATSLHEKMVPLRAEIDREIKAGEIDPAGPVEGLKHQLAFVEEIREHSGAPDEAVFAQLRSMTGLAEHISPKVRKACEDLMASVEADGREREKNHDTATDILLKEAASAIRAANAAPDLDPVLAKLLQATRGERGPIDFRMSDRLRRAMEMIGRWQHDLDEFGHGEFSRTDDVRSISQMSLEFFGSEIPASFYEERRNLLAANLKKRVDDAVTAAVRALPLAKSETDIRRIRDSLAPFEKYKLVGGLGEDLVRRLNGVNSLCGDLSELLRNEAPGTFRFALSSFHRFQTNAHANAGLISEADVKAREDFLFAEAARQLAEMLDRTTRELPEVKVPDEISQMDVGFSDFKEALRSRSHDYAELLLRLERVSRVADEWRLVIIAQNQNDHMQSGRIFKELSEINSGPNPVIPLSVVEQKRKAMGVSETTAGVTAPDRSNAETWMASLPAKIRAIDKISDAVTLRDEVQTRMQAASGNARNGFGELNRLQSDLRMLADFMEACDRGSFSFEMLRIMQVDAAHPWRAEVTETRARIARQVISNLLQDAEFLRVPMDATALENAVLQRADDAAKKRDWPKTYKLLALCARTDRFGQSQISEDVAGIADYFTGQKLEKAEQWPEAIRAYQNVLRRAGERLPVAEATDRLRALKREHPEASAAPAPASPEIVR